MVLFGHGISSAVSPTASSKLARSAPWSGNVEYREATGPPGRFDGPQSTVARAPGTGGSTAWQTPGS